MTNPTDPGSISVTTAPSGGNHAAPDSPAAPVSQVAAANGSPLAALRDRRKKMAELLHKDFRVPRWGDDGGPMIYVRYAPAAPSEYADRFEKLQKQQNKPKDWVVSANAQILVGACIGVYACEGPEPVDGEPDNRPKLSLRDGDPHGAWTKFDPELADSLGLAPNCGAIAVVRGLYLTEGDIISTAAKLQRWSGMVAPADNEDFSGS